LATDFCFGVVPTKNLRIRSSEIEFEDYFSSIRVTVLLEYTDAVDGVRLRAKFPIPQHFEATTIISTSYYMYTY